MTEFKNLKFYSVKVEKGNNDFELEYTWEFVIDNQNISIKYINNLKTKLRKIFFYQYLMKEEYFYDNNYTNEFYIKGHNYKIVHENVFLSLYIDFKYINPLQICSRKQVSMRSETPLRQSAVISVRTDMTSSAFP